MGLRTDILKAFEKNLTHIEIVDGESEIVKPPTGEFSKLDILATDLMLAIKDFIQAQTFQITNMEAPLKIPALGIQTQVSTTVTGTGTIPGGGPLLPIGNIGTGTGLNQKPVFGLAQISNKGSKVDGRVKPAVNTSEVKLLKVEEDD
ncbi:hypothetical protein CMI47_20820 [Candidatus Pacearchaeota archaeon]|nr:hypothetical protein [Candidatus Pacearchaeota archaeon]|tara:strand:- start:3168 stop:3608 length:441 start_codon:yes stop_codon:yes gene_type:complete